MELNSVLEVGFAIDVIVVVLSVGDDDDEW
jgi:hypothetical protein